MIRSLPRSKSSLGSLACPACALSSGSARSFSTAHAQTHSSPRASCSPSTSSPLQSTSGLRLGRSSPQATRWSSSSAAEVEETPEEREERIAGAEMAELEAIMRQFESHQVDHVDFTPSQSAYDGAFELDELVSTARDPPPPAPAAGPVERAPVAPALNPFALLRPSFPAGDPTVADLNALKPKQHPRPDASSPEYARILYTKSWNSGLAKLNTAFKKSQLLKIVSQSTEQGGLELKADDQRLRAGTKARKAKWWKPKKFTDMSKRELSQAIMVLEWGMVDPEVLPKPRVGATVVETLPLADRTVFLLLSPNATTLPNISRAYGVKASFSRDPSTGGLLLSLRGTKASVQQAKEEVTSLPELSHQQEFELPAPATTLRPELFQAVSRLSKTFLEPAAEPDMLAATAIDRASIDRAERLLNTAFTTDAIQSSVRTFVTLPTSLDSLEYSLFPFTPAVPAPWTAGATSSFARVQGVSLAPLPSDGQEHAEHAAKLDFAKWAADTHMDSTARVPLSSTGPRKVLPALLAPFSNEAKLEMRATFGHVVWPVYPPTQQPTEGKAPLGLGPVLDGRWKFTAFAKWRAELGSATKSVFLPSPPSGFLHSTGVLNQVSDGSPFAAIMTGLEFDAAIEDPDALPKMESDDFRQLVYRPLSLVKEGELNERIEVEYSEEGIKASLMRENKVMVMVPNGTQDFAVAATETQELAPETIAELPAQLVAGAPTLIHLNSVPYLLSSDRAVRRTFLLPSSTSPTFEHPRIQERWEDNTEGGRGSEVSLVLGEGSGANFWQRVWKAGLREVEKSVQRPRVDGGTERVRLFRGR